MIKAYLILLSRHEIVFITMHRSSSFWYKHITTKKIIILFDDFSVYDYFPYIYFRNLGYYKNKKYGKEKEKKMMRIMFGLPNF